MFATVRATLAEFQGVLPIGSGANFAPEPQSLGAQPEFGWSATRAGDRLQIILLDKLPETRPRHAANRPPQRVSVNSVTSAGQFIRIGAPTMPIPRFV